MHYTRRFALGAIASAVLAGCGGGGGGGSPTTDAGGSDGQPSGGVGGTGGGTPPAQSFAAFGPSVVASGHSVGNSVAVARLSDGRSVVLWVFERQVMGRFLAADGTAGAQFVAVPLMTITGAMLQPYDVNLASLAVVATTDGGFALAYVQESSQPFSSQAAPWALRLRRFAADSSVAWDTLARDSMSSVYGPCITVAGNAFILSWSSRIGTFGTFSGALRRFDASGNSGASASLQSPGGGVGSAVSVASLPDGTVVAGWQSMSIGPVIPTGCLAHFSNDLTLLSQTVLPVEPGQASTEVAVGALPDGNVAVAWGDRDAANLPRAHVQVLTPAGEAVSVRQTTPMEFGLWQAAVVPFGANGFGVAWQVHRQASLTSTGQLFLWRFDAAGTPVAEPEQVESRLTYHASPTDGTAVNAGTGYDIDGGADGHYVATFGRANQSRADLYVMAR